MDDDGARVDSAEYRDDRRGVPREREIEPAPGGQVEMKMKMKSIALALVLLPVSVSAQWLNHPTVGVPRTPDGRPNLNAPTPRAADGKPDLSGLWVNETKRAANANFPGCDAVSDELINIAAKLTGGLPYQPWAK